MFDKLDFILSKYEELNDMLSDANIIADQNKFRELAKEHAHIEPIVNKYIEYKKKRDDLAGNKELLNDKLDRDFRKMVEEDIAQLSEELEQAAEELKILLLPKDPNDEKSVIIEIRAGTGGDEAALFAGDLLRMYMRYAERKRFKTEILSSNPIGIGGYKEIIFSIEGMGAYSRLKYESGVHRVQRIPQTESGGRIHTSASTVAVLPEAEDVEINISPNDLRIDVFRSGGHGGQSVNTTDSAVRITHLPTGVVVTCQDEKSQLKNKEKAMKVLKARIYEMELKKHSEEMAQNRKSQVGSGDRSERIRTYNFPQGRITDHRIGMTVYKLEAFLDGEIDEMIDALHLAEQAELLSSQE
jgi:peptide chain release factor 1